MYSTVHTTEVKRDQMPYAARSIYLLAYGFYTAVLHGCHEATSRRSRVQRNVILAGPFSEAFSCGRTSGCASLARRLS